MTDLEKSSSEYQNAVEKYSVSKDSVAASFLSPPDNAEFCERLGRMAESLKLEISNVGEVSLLL